MGQTLVERPFDTLYPKVSTNISPETSVKKAPLTVSYKARGSHVVNRLFTLNDLAIISLEK